MYRGRPPSSISWIRPPKLDSFGGEHPKALLYLPQASPLAIPSCTELPIRSRIIIHGCPWSPPFPAANPIGNPQNRILSPSSLSNHALRFGNGGLYLDSAEAPVNWHGTSTVAVPRRPIATAGIDQLQRGHRINCNATEVHSEQQMHRPWRLQLRHCTNCNSMDKLQLDANQTQPSCNSRRNCNQTQPSCN